MIRRILTGILMILLCACAQNRLDDLKNPPSRVSANEVTARALSYLVVNHDLEKDYSFSDGIQTLDLKKKLSEGKTSVFAMYCDESPVFLLLHDEKGDRIVSPEAVLERMAEDRKYIIAEAEGNIYCLFADGALLIDGDENYRMSDDTARLIKEAGAAINEENPMSLNMTPITKKSSSDSKPAAYANDRIIVRFKDGDRKKQIEDYEKFCHGKAQSEPGNDDVYIFVFDPISEEEMQKLIEESRKLDYVMAVSADKINEAQKPAYNRE